MCMRNSVFLLAALLLINVNAEQPWSILESIYDLIDFRVKFKLSLYDNESSSFSYGINCFFSNFILKKPENIRVFSNFIFEKKPENIYSTLGKRKCRRTMEQP